MLGCALVVGDLGGTPGDPGNLEMVNAEHASWGAQKTGEGLMGGFETACPGGGRTRVCRTESVVAPWDLSPLRRGVRAGRTVRTPASCPVRARPRLPQKCADHGEGRQATVVTQSPGFVCERCCGLWGPPSPPKGHPFFLECSRCLGSRGSNPRPCLPDYPFLGLAINP